jgi:hypothetical protein
MSREELCAQLQAPSDAAPGELVAAWEKRRSDLVAALAQVGNARPVKLRLQQELRRCEEGAGVAAHLRVAAQIARYLAEFEPEGATPAPARVSLRLCLDKAKALLNGLPEGELRFEWEKRWASAEESLAAKQPPFAVAPGPEAPIATGAGAGTVLELRPLEIEGTLRRSAPMVRIVARTHFTLGRKASANFTTRFWPESEENRQKTSTISRINTTLFFRGRQVCIQDGQIGEDGAAIPSRNGTIVDDQRIGAATVLNFAKERRLKLGQCLFEVRALQFQATSAESPWAERPNPVPCVPQAPAPPDRPSGCIRFWPAGLRHAPLIGIWIFSELALGSGAVAAVMLDHPLPAVAGRIHYFDGGFWLGVPDDGKSVVTLDGRRRSAGDVVPLQACHELRLGEIGFEVKLL